MLQQVHVYRTRFMVKYLSFWQGSLDGTELRDEPDDLSDLTEEEQGSLRGWAGTFGKYPVVGMGHSTSDI